MKDFSEPSESAFKELREPQISTLVALLQESRIKKYDYVRRRYLERAPQFDRTLRFLTGIGAVHDEAGDLIMAQVLQELRGPAAREALAAVVINLILGNESCFRSELFDYIGRFRVEHGSAVYRPSVEERSAESAVRNLLMEWSVVAFDPSANRYVLAAEHAALYAHSQLREKYVSPAEFERTRRDNEDLGLAAERAIVAFERERLGPGFSDRVEHVALRNIAAGYDILSFSVADENSVLPRYIEAKAVPERNLRFFWTANEVRVAEIFGSCYYLYLLPVDRQGAFRIEGLRIIADPHLVVLRSSADWLVESNVLQCSLAPKIASSLGSSGV
jgi:hypothetical protein